VETLVTLKWAEDYAKRAFEKGKEVGYGSGWNFNKPHRPDADGPWDREQTVFEGGKKEGIKEGTLRTISWAKSLGYFRGLQPTIDNQLKEWGILAP